jgi:murein DD-endopeptidase MepM/ murein hydrolase activator NlpD
MIDSLSMLTPPTEASATPKNKEEAAIQFEAMFTRMLLKEMRESMPEDGMFSSKEMSMFMGMLDEHLAEELARQGGLGLAKGMKSYMQTATETTAPKTRDRMPVKGQITSGFGNRTDPIKGVHRHHDGMDIAAPEGTPIRSIRGGEVSFSGERGGYGNVAIVDHGNGLTTRYAHCRDLNVKTGDKVYPGTILGTVGSTGRSTGPHLHLEARRNGKAVDPESLFGWKNSDSTQTETVAIREDKRVRPFQR